MNDKRLQIYLDDHLALIVGEVQLIRRCRSNNRSTSLGEFLQRLEDEVDTQKALARDTIQKIVGKETTESRIKQGAAWFAEKLGRFKFNDSLLSYSDLSRVVELETLAAAAQERVALWDTLDTIATGDVRLDRITFSVFRDQSQQHLDELNTHRRWAAAEAFLGDSAKP